MPSTFKTFPDANILAQDSEFIFSKDERDRKFLKVVKGVIIWTDFAGKGREDSKFPPTGNGSFNVVIPDDAVEYLENEGFRVKTYRSKTNPDNVLYYIEVIVNRKSYFPEIISCTEFKGRKSKRRHSCDTVGLLDDVLFERADIKINPYDKDKDGRVTGYLNKLNVILKKAVDEFDPIYDEYEEEYSYSDTDDESNDEGIPF